MKNGRPDEVVRLVVWQKLFREDANCEELARAGASSSS